MQNELAIHLDAFLAAAEEASFSAAARRLGVTPAAVSKSVARLETGLGVRLFQRSTRSLSLTGEGERLYGNVGLAWRDIGDAFGELRQGAGQPAGQIRIALAPAVGRRYIVPLLEGFLAQYPDIVPDCSFDNRQVDLIGEGFDVAIGGGIELTEGLVARELAQVRIVLAASPAYLARHGTPQEPSALAQHRGLLRRAIVSRRLVSWDLHSDGGERFVAGIRPAAVFDDPEAMAHAAASGLGIALLPLPHALPLLDNGELMRILPHWHAQTRPLNIYYASRKLVPAKVRVFVEYIIERFRSSGVADRFSQG